MQQGIVEDAGVPHVFVYATRGDSFLIYFIYGSNCERKQVALNPVWKVTGFNEVFVFISVVRAFIYDLVNLQSSF